MPFHGLRHSYASLLVAAHVAPAVAMKMLSHANIQTTLNVYSHVETKLMGDAATAVRAVLGK